jgi:hypothetical protein
MGKSRRRWFSQLLEDIKRKEIKSKRKDYEKAKETRDLRFMISIICKQC